MAILAMGQVVLSAVADDADHADSDFNAGDTVTLTLDRATNRGGGPWEGGKAFVDTLLRFDHAMGADYSGVWRDASTFVFTAIDTASSRPPLVGLTMARQQRGQSAPLAAPELSSRASSGRAWRI